MARREETYRQIDKELDEGVHLTSNIKRVAVETENTSNDTSRMLHHQTEQLQGIDRRLDGIDGNLKASDKSLKEVESFWYSMLPKSWKRDSKPSARPSVSPGKSGAPASQKTSSGTSNSRGQYISPIVGDDRERQMNEDLKEVDDILDRIHSNALHQREVLDYHNQDLLPRLQQKTEKTDDDVTKLNKRIGKQLR